MRTGLMLEQPTELTLSGMFLPICLRVERTTGGTGLDLISGSIEGCPPGARPSDDRCLFFLPDSLVWSLSLSLSLSLVGGDIFMQDKLL